MKTRICLLISVLATMALHAQEIDLTGTWTMYEMTWTSGQDATTTTEEQLKEEGMMSDYYFGPDGSFKLVSNMTGSGEMETVEGTWELEADHLNLQLTMGERSMGLQWDFSLHGEGFDLKRTSPDGSTTVVNCFKRKETE